MKKHYLLLSTLITLQAFCQTAYDSNELLTKGIEQHKQGNYTDAIKNYQEINISDPNYLIGQYELISSYLGAGELTKSLEISTKLYNDNKFKELPQLLALHGIVLSTNNQLSEALAIFEQAEKQFPESTHVLFNKAVVYQKQENLQAALDVYKKVITIDPSHTSALYNLGLIALEDGKIVHGSMALMTYLMVEPVGNNAKSALLLLNKKYHQNYNKKATLNYGENVTEYKELEQLLMAQVQLHKDFSLKVSIDDVVTRNMQFILDYLENYNLKNNDFYDTKMAFYLKEIATKKHTTNYIYTATLSVADAFEKDLEKNQKNIESYIETFLKTDILPKFYTVTKNNNLYRVYREGYEKAFVQVKPTDFDFKEGKGYSENNLGPKTSETNFKNNLLNGLKTNYSANGFIISEENYKDDKLSGINKEYFANQILNSEFTYVNGNLNGTYKTYYPTKNINCSGEYLNNEYNGKAECFFPNGSPKIIAHYTNGNFNGLYEGYNEIGNLIFKTNYVNNEINGEITEYYDDKTLKRLGKYDNGKAISDIYYFANGKVSNEYLYTDGKITMVTNYRVDGSILNKVMYDNKERKLEHHDYNRNNEIYQKDFYKNGRFSKSEYNLPNVVTAPVSNKKQTNYNAIGKVISEGNYEKEVMVGEWNFYDALGKVKTKFFYDENGNVTNAKGFNTNGSLDYTVNYKDNNYYGKHEQFLNNKPIQITNYNENGLNGPETVYYPTGTVQYNSFYTNNSLSSNRYTYTLNNKLATTEYFINNVLVCVTNHLTPTPTVFNFEGKTGVFDAKITPATTLKYQLKNGAKNGEVVTTAGDIIISKENYVNNVQHGKQEYFNILGNKTTEVHLLNGTKINTSNWYDELGNLRTSSTHEKDLITEKITHYYYNQKPYSIINYDNDLKHNAHTYYSFNGDKAAEIIYYEGTPIKYTAFDNKGNQFTKEITNGTFDLISYYKNGIKSLEINFKDYNYNGVYSLFFENGKPAIEMTYTNGLQNNFQTAYYNNGNIYCKKEYSNNMLTNTTSYYQENGNKAIDIQYNNDLLHGNYTIYENNKIKTTAKYDSNILVEI